MNLLEAQKFVGKRVNINWGPLDRPIRKNETIPQETVCIEVESIYENCHNEILAFMKNTIMVPVRVERLSLYE